MVLQSPEASSSKSCLLTWSNWGDNTRQLAILMSAPSLLSYHVFPGRLCRVLENRLELPFATHCRNTAQDSCIFPQLTLAESYISLCAQWPPIPPTNISVPPAYLQADTSHLSQPALPFLSWRNWLLTKHLRKLCFGYPWVMRLAEDYQAFLLLHALSQHSGFPSPDECSAKGG